MDMVRSPEGGPEDRSGGNSLPRRTLRIFDAMTIVIGIVIGSGIFFMPSLVAANAPGPVFLLGLWLAGGVVGMVGALCYAELTTAYPNAGGDYYFLRRAYGPEIAFLFAWGRMTVIQTGALAAAAFIAGNYLAEALPVGSPAFHAAVLVVALTALNLRGLTLGKGVQNVLTSAVAVGLFVVALAGIIVWFTGPDGAGGAAAVASAPGGAGEPTPDFTSPQFFSSLGLAMVFVLYTYGGWNEAAYLSAEIQAPQRNIAMALLSGVGAVTVIYLLVNLAFLGGLGIDGMAGSNAVAADLLRQVAGEGGALFISILVVVAVLSTVNATIITGGRSNYALGRDYPEVFGFMGRWSTASSVPVAALVVQGGVSLVLILLAPLIFDEGGVEAMVAYTAPVFWFFFFLVGLSVLILRAWDPGASRPFRVPMYPLTPFLFCLVCVYMLFSAVAYAGVGSLLGVAVLLAGLPFLSLIRRRQLGGDSAGI